MSTMARCEQCGERFDYASQRMHIHGETYTAGTCSASTKAGQTSVDAVEGGKVYFNTGSTRSDEWEEYRYDLISPYALKALAKIYAEGARVHGDRNWEKGQPHGVVLNHLKAHLNQYEANRCAVGPCAPEDHLAKVMWGIAALIHYRDCPEYEEPNNENQ